MRFDVLVVGAGYAGSVVAERLARAGKRVHVIDKRPHVGDNAYDEYDKRSLLHSKPPSSPPIKRSGTATLARRFALLD